MSKVWQYITRLSVMLLLAALPAVVSAEITVTSRAYTTNEGFPDNNIRCIAQDETGYIWFGSQYGLYRYDGYSYKKMVPTPDGDTKMLLAQHIEEIRPWRDGLLWIRQRGNFSSCYDCRKGRFVDYTGCGRYRTTYKRSVMGRNGEILLYDNTNGTATVTYDGHRFTFKRETHDNAAPKSKDGSFGDNRGNKVRNIGNGAIEYTDKETGITTTIDVYPRLLRQKGLSPKIKVVTQASGLVWISTYGNGLFCYDKQTRTLRHIAKDDGSNLISSNFIVSMAEDHDGNIWLSLEHHGVVCLTTTRKRYDAVYYGDARTYERVNEARLLCRLDDGNVISSNNSGTIGWLTAGRLDITSVTDTLCYISAAIGPHGELWTGTRRDGLIAGGRTYRHSESDPNSLSSDRVDCVLRDRSGRMWLSGMGGYIDLATAAADGSLTFRHIIRQGGMFEPRKMILDRHGNIWVGSHNELIVFNPDSMAEGKRLLRRTIPLKTTSNAAPVLCLHEDRRGRIWAGTNGNGIVIRETDGRQRHLTVAGGLVNNVIRFIGEDGHGNVWVGTANGCSVIRPDGKISSVFFGNEKLQNTFGEGCVARLHDGRMALGSFNGIIITDARHLPSGGTDSSRHITITGFDTNGIPLTEADCTGNALSPSDNVRLDHNQNTITVRFSDFNYSNLRSSRYSYMLDGYDTQWSQWSQLNFATYRNLPPGDYTLHVRLAGSSRTASIGIVIAPPAWASAWAFALYALLALTVAVIVWRQLRTVYRLRRDIAVEKRLTEFKINFFTDISHEFRTPLTLIKGTVDKIRHTPDLPAGIRQSADSLRRNADRMLRLINQLLEFRRMEENRLSLTLEETELTQFLQSIVYSFHDAAETRGISLCYRPQEKERTIFVDRGFIDKIVYELLSNAMKYTPRGGSVTLHTRNDGLWQEITVEDTGIGVEPERREAIFARYVKGQHSSNSLGIGLNLTRELARTHLGSITCSANPGGGSVFTVRIPATTDGYKPSDFLSGNGNLQRKQEEATNGFEPAGSGMAAVPLNDRHVLIADDDADIAAFLRQELGHFFHTDTAADGQEALEKARQHRPDLVISDVKMPRMDGYELTRRLRSDKTTAGVPVILLTALDGDDERYLGLQTGADAYLTKPFSTRLLVMQCRNLMTRNMAAGRDGGKSPAAPQPEIITDGADRRWLDTLNVYVDSHLADTDLSVDKIAARMNLGRTKFYAKVKALTAMTPNDFIREKRLQKAAELLSDDTVTVAEVAYQVGMNTPQYLSSCFKKRFGVSPSQYQKGETARLQDYSP